MGALTARRRGFASFRYRPLLAVLAVGVAVRAFTVVFYDHAVFSYYGGDSARYLRLYTGALFGDRYMPAGYPAFLRGLRGLWPVLPLPIVLQHLIGLATAVVLFAAMRRFGAPRAAAVVPAAAVALSGDNVFLEHALLTETLWGFSIALALYALARAYEQQRMGWLAGAGALLACSALVRNTSLALLPLAAVWAAVAFSGPVRARARTAVVLALPAVAVVGAYVALAHAAGKHDGLVEGGGDLLYVRVAPFADCKRFRPPAATARLCETTPPDQRLGPLHYMGFDYPAPVNTQYRTRPSPAALGAFARQAILHQPLDYLRAALRDGARYFAPHTGAYRPDSGARPEEMSFGHTDPVVQPVTREGQAAKYRLVYSGVGRPKAPGAAFSLLSAYQEVFRVGGLALAGVAALIVGGLAFARGRRRAVIALLAALALVMYGLAPLTFTYDVRYGVTPAPLACAAAALALVALLERRRIRAGGEPGDHR